jgi:hypothetical protein
VTPALISRVILWFLLLLLIRYLESLKVITGVLVSSLGSFAAIVMLLALFWMVFSIVGLHVFGGLELDVFDETANFNSLINAMVLNFNVSGGGIVLQGRASNGKGTDMGVILGE